MKCIQTDSSLDVKKTFAFVYVAFGCLAMIYYNELFTINLNQNEIDYKHWDNKTVTLNDFTVELKVSKKMWRDFRVV